MTKVINNACQIVIIYKNNPSNYVCDDAYMCWRVCFYWSSTLESSILRSTAAFRQSSKIDTKSYCDNVSRPACVVPPLEVIFFLKLSHAQI